MANRLDINHINEVAKGRGGKCLSKEYKEQYEPLTWMCAKGHTFESCYKIIQQGCWCAQCIKDEVRIERLEKIKLLAQEKGGKCLSTVYYGNKINVTWQCQNNHIWQARPNAITSGQWCPKCKYIKLGIQLRGNINDICKIIETRGGKLLSREYINNRSHIEVQCVNNHIWKTKPDAIKKGRWCPHCSHRAKLTIDEMHEMAALHSGKCLSLVYHHNRTKLKWQCKKGHTWLADAHTIKGGHWCPHCTHRARLTIEEMQSIASKRNGQCLSSTYVNATTKLQWQCHKFHTWFATPGSIKFGQWCPGCAREKQKSSPTLFKKKSRPA